VVKLASLLGRLPVNISEVYRRETFVDFETALHFVGPQEFVCVPVDCRLHHFVDLQDQSQVVREECFGWDLQEKPRRTLAKVYRTAFFTGPNRTDLVSVLDLISMSFQAFRREAGLGRKRFSDVVKELH